jgi:hypothetical protein
LYFVRRVNCIRHVLFFGQAAGPLYEKAVGMEAHWACSWVGVTSAFRRFWERPQGPTQGAPGSPCSSPRVPKPEPGRIKEPKPQGLSAGPGRLDACPGCVNASGSKDSVLSRRRWRGMMMVMVQTTPRKTCLHDSHIHDDHREQGKALVLRIFEARFHRCTLPHC